jgi:2-hydroxychromene-2-carboxylate isomerase
MGEPVTFFYGIGSRYSYLASTQLDALEQATGCDIIWRPLVSGALTTLRGRDPFAGDAVSGQYEWPYRRADAEAWAEYYGVPFVEPNREALDPRLLARACAAANRLGAIRAMSRSLFRAVFVESIAPIEAAECCRRALALGLPGDEFRALLTDPRVDEDLQRAAYEAHTRGAFGVPTFIVRERMFWGNDRLVLIRHYLEQRRGGA